MDYRLMFEPSNQWLVKAIHSINQNLLGAAFHACGDA